MALPFARPENWVNGQEIDAADLQDIQAWARMKDGIVAYGLGGTNAFLPTNGALTVAPGSGLQVLVGPSGSAVQLAFLPSTTADGTWKSVTGNNQSGQVAFAAYTNVQTPITLAGSGSIPAGQSRIDIVCVRFKQTNVNAHTTNVASGPQSGPTITPETVYHFDDTLDAPVVVTGTPGTSPSPPSPPDSTYSVLAEVSVSSGQSQILQGNILIVMPNFPAIIAGYLAGPPLAGLLQSGPGISIAPNGPKVVIANAGVLSLQGLVGAIGFESNSGITFNADGSDNNVDVELGQGSAQALGFVNCRIRSCNLSALNNALIATTTSNSHMPQVGNKITVNTSTDISGAYPALSYVGVISLDGTLQWIAQVFAVNPAQVTLQCVEIQLGVSSTLMPSGAQIQGTCFTENTGHYWQVGTMIPPEGGLSGIAPFITSLGALVIAHGANSPCGAVQQEWRITCASAGLPVTIQIPVTGDLISLKTLFVDGVVQANVLPGAEGTLGYTFTDTSLHVLVVQHAFTQTGSTNTAFAGYDGQWIPSNGSGGVNTNQIAQITPGDPNYGPLNVPGH